MKKIKVFFKEDQKNIFLLLVMATFLFTSCQKENMNELASPEIALAKKEKLVDPNVQPNHKEGESITLKESAEVATSRGVTSSTTLIYQNKYTVNEGDWLNLYFPKNQLPDPTMYKLDVEILPVNGDPDLYIYGVENMNTVWGHNPWRMIRKSVNGGTASDHASFRQSDLKIVEDQLFISVYGYSKSEYEIYIYQTTVQCQEFPVAEPMITLDINPVCGCNGKEYINESAAFADGLTYWTTGPCNTIDGTWVPADSVFSPITQMVISNNSTIIELFGECDPGECSWGEAILYDEEHHYSAFFDMILVTISIELQKQEDGRMEMTVTTNYPDNREEVKIYYFSLL